MRSRQLELRGEYGRGFRLQRVAWGNPVFRTRTADALRSALERNRKKHEKILAFVPQYPDAPEWKTCRIRKVAWNGFANAYRIEGKEFEALLVPEYGGRILEFRRKDGENLLKTTVYPGAAGFCADGLRTGAADISCVVTPPPPSIRTIRF